MASKKCTGRPAPSICRFCNKISALRSRADRHVLFDQDHRTTQAGIESDLKCDRYRELPLVAGLMAGPVVAEAVAPPPTIPVFDCNQGQTLPGAQVTDPAGSSNATAKRAFVETTSVAAFYAQVFGRNSIDGAGMSMISS